MHADSVIFDLDGTLWDSTDVVVKAWNEVLGASGYQLTENEIRGIMGLQLSAIGEKLFPKLGAEERMRLMQKCCDYECDLIRQEGGRLFTGLVPTLQKLSSKLPLFIVSNCQHGYIEAFLAYHKLSVYFKDFQCADTEGLPKGENIKAVIKRNALKNAVYVGDTQVDCDAASLAEIPFLFASYGFGKVTDCAYSVHAPEELSNLILNP
jgi:phosphoglycolate phosphatase